MTQFKPLLAAELTDPAKLKFPFYGSPKIDGIRALVRNAHLVSRTLKPIPNLFIRAWLSHAAYEGLDGELYVGPTFQDTTSSVMRHAGEPEFTFMVFDDTTFAEKCYDARLDLLSTRAFPPDAPIRLVTQTVIRCPAEVDQFMEKCLNDGYEGAMLRDPNAAYKFGRSTEREGVLLKLKSFKDDEAKIIGFEELMINENEAKTDALGHTKRGHSKGNMVPGGTLGALVVKHPTFGVFKIGTGIGLTDAFRASVWKNRISYLGCWAKFKYQPDGVKNKPRIPSLQGIRDPIDMGEPD